MVVLLAGTFDYDFTDWETRALRTGEARFEIRMRGTNYYYAERWIGHQWKYNSWDSLTLSLPDFSGTWGRSFAGSGHHGRGGSSDASDDSLLVGRRLWRGDEFIGATAADEYSLDHQSERFLKLKQMGRFQIPELIEFYDGVRKEILHVRKVEFLNQPDPDWFCLIQQKYFGHGESSRQLYGTNLHEAGWSGETNR